MEEEVAEMGWRLLPVFGGECTGQEDSSAALQQNMTVNQDLILLASGARSTRTELHLAKCDRNVMSRTIACDIGVQVAGDTD